MGAGRAFQLPQSGDSVRDGRFVEDVLTACGFFRLDETGAGDVGAPEAWREEMKGEGVSPGRTWNGLGAFGRRAGGLEGGLGCDG